MKVLTRLLPKEITIFLTRTKKAVALSVVPFMLLASAPSFAGPYSSAHVFGDSLSDAGAFSILAPAFCPPVPYFDCRFSNGPVWAEVLAAELGVSAATAYAGGTNWAIGGKRTDEILSEQLPGYLGTTGGVADADALYIIWGGGNDFLQNDPVGTYDPIDAANNIISTVTGLSAAGATDFLIPNLPVLEAWGFAFNAQLAAGLGSLGGALNITQFDAFGLIIDMNINPGDYGFTNTVDPCLDFGAGTLCTNPDEYLLWDSVHPTLTAHEAIAAAALAALAIPAPATIVLFGLGLIGLGWSRRAKA